jgi:uracil-DNA glycosylase
MSYPDFFKLCTRWSDFFYDNDTETILISILEHVKGDHIFRCFELTPFDSISVIFIGREPTSHCFTGLSYEVSRGHILSHEIQHIYKELEEDGYYPTKDGNLEHWAKQGVLLLNTSLTMGQQDVWEPFILCVLKKLSTKENLVWVVEDDFLYKNHITNSKHLVLNRKQSKLFKTINHQLYNQGIEKISW